MKKETNERKTVVKRIFEIIHESKLTYKEFAYSCSISPGNVTDWKTGRSKPSMEALRKISKEYKVQLEWLTGDSKYRTKEEEFLIYKEREEKK